MGAAHDEMNERMFQDVIKHYLMVCVCVCVCAWVRACVRACVCLCVRQRAECRSEPRRRPTRMHAPRCSAVQLHKRDQARIALMFPQDDSGIPEEEGKTFAELCWKAQDSLDAIQRTQFHHVLHRSVLCKGNGTVVFVTLCCHGYHAAATSPTLHSPLTLLYAATCIAVYHHSYHSTAPSPSRHTETLITLYRHSSHSRVPFQTIIPFARYCILLLRHFIPPSPSVCTASPFALYSPSATPHTLPTILTVGPPLPNALFGPNSVKNAKRKTVRVAEVGSGQVVPTRETKGSSMEKKLFNVQMLELVDGLVPMSMADEDREVLETILSESQWIMSEVAKVTFKRVMQAITKRVWPVCQR